MRRQKRISRYLPSVCRSGDRVNPLGEYRLQGTRISLEALRRDLGRLAWKDLFEAGIQRVQRLNSYLARPEPTES